MERISEATYRMLMAQGLARRTVGAVGTSGIGDGERSPAKGALGHQTAEGGDRPIKGPVVSPAKFEPRIIEGGSRYKGVSTAPLYLVQP